MKQIPYIKSNVRREIVQFRGINYTDMQSDGDIVDSKNISAERFPFITTAKSDEKLAGAAYTGVKAMAAYKKLYTFTGGKMYINGADSGITTEAEEKQTAMIGNGSMLVLPDEKIFAPQGRSVSQSQYITDLTKFYAVFDEKNIDCIGRHIFFPIFKGEKTCTQINAMDAYISSSAAIETYYKVTDSGSVTSYTVSGGSVTETDISVAVGQIIKVIYDQFLSDGSANRYYRSITKNVVQGGEVISSASFEADKVAYVSDPANDLNGPVDDPKKWGLELPQTVEYFDITKETGWGDPSLGVVAKYTGNNTYTSEYQLNKFTAENDYILIKGRNDTKYGETVNKVTAVGQNTLTAQGFTPFENFHYTFRKCEVPDFACAWANRIWACNSEKQLIFASEQGKPESFYANQGIAIGSYSVAVGDQEWFTGCCEYGNSVLFFKQNRIYKIVGTSPKNYQLYTYNVEGVKKGCHKSLCVINEVLYYVGLHGVYAYAGGNPVLISERLGGVDIQNAAGGTDGERYYLSFDDGTENYLFIYEPKYRVWILKDNVKVADFARTEDDFYYLIEDSVYRADTAPTSDACEWYVQFAPFYETLEKKHFTRFLIRCELNKKSHMTVKVRYDGGLWNDEAHIIGEEGVREVRLPINRCDRMELRIEGKGKCTIREVGREFEVGSDV